MHLEVMIVRVWRYVVGGYDHAKLEVVINQFGSRNQASLEMHLEAVIERVSKYTATT